MQIIANNQHTVKYQAGRRTELPTAREQATADAKPCANRETSTPSPYHLPQSWSEFLSSFPWDWYGHFSFEGSPHPESACKVWDMFIHKLNRYTYGQRYWKDKNKGAIWARGTEYQARGAVHFHAVIGGVPDYVNRVGFREWWNDTAGICKIDQYEKDKGAEYYMSKSAYAWKQGEVDLSDTLTLYQRGSWVSAKTLHEQYCREVSFLRSNDLTAYAW